MEKRKSVRAQMVEWQAQQRAKGVDRFFKQEGKTKRDPYFRLAMVSAIVAAVVVPVINYAILSPEAMTGRRLAKTAKKLNADCPVMVDDVMRFDNAVAGPGATMTCNYTLLFPVDRGVNRAAFVAAMKPGLVASLRRNSESQAMLRDGVTFVYSYNLTNGVSVAVISITPKDCGF